MHNGMCITIKNKGTFLSYSQSYPQFPQDVDKKYNKIM